MLLKLLKVAQKYLETFEIWWCRRMEKRSVGPIVWEMKKCYIGWRRAGTPYI